ncbi:DUF6160 family protein [Acinetobacter sp. CFCC 10889]|uniref:DUF6160 family protein n=1 Tax=Acinetobacter sp. CFCC 10889 TaxID=1775557 RepID=UPI000DD0EC48|nr:DUF6160 family protein [Acinetobacter sp. CFCC 10889]
MRKKIIQLNILTLSILCAQQSFALQELEDSSLSQIAGQDGISLQIEANKVQIGEVNWKDSTQTTAGADSVLNVSMRNVETTPYETTPYGSSSGLSAKFTADVGGKAGASATASNGLSLSAVFGPATMHIGSLAICPNGTGITANCTGTASQSLGALTFQNRKDLTFSLETGSGLFNGGSPATLGFGLKNANLFYTLNNGGKYNQFILKDFNFNFSGKGYLYLDPAEGLVLSTNQKGGASSTNTVVLADVDDPDFSGQKQPGLNVDLRYKKDVKNVYTAYTATGVDTDIYSFGRLGASGTLKNAYIKVNGTQDIPLGPTTSGTTNTGTGNLVGKGGLHLQMKADFVKDSDPAATQKTYLDLGMSGKNAYALRYGNLTPLQVRKNAATSSALNPDSAYINFGHVYVNAAQTNTVNFPLSDVLNKIYSGNLSSSTIKTALYNSPSATPANALIVAIRGMDFQAIARQGQLVADNSANAVATTPNSTWGLGLPIYNLNSNVGLYGINDATTKKQSIGFGITMSTTGRDAAGSKTTSMLLIDGAPIAGTSDTVNYYAGLRNINLLADLTGSLSLEDDGLKIALPQFLIGLDGELAIGQLPGSRIVTSGCASSTASNCFIASDSFTKNTDVLFGIMARLVGSANLTLIPSSATGDGSLGIKGDMTLGSNTKATSSYLRISDKSVAATSAPQLGLDNLSGQMSLDSKIGMNANTITFANTVNLNSARNDASSAIKAKAPENVLRADVNLYPTNITTPQKLGEIVFTGGNIRSNFGITPR